jgi:hypothetical protein
MELKTKRAAGAVLLWWRRRIGGESKNGGQIISGAAPVGIEEDGWLVVSRVRAYQLRILLAVYVSAKASIVGTKQQLAFDLGIELLSMSRTNDSGTQKRK